VPPPPHEDHFICGARQSSLRILLTGRHAHRGERCTSASPSLLFFKASTQDVKFLFVSSNSEETDKNKRISGAGQDVSLFSGVR
jgi:hypothetical protein